MFQIEPRTDPIVSSIKEITMRKSGSCKAILRHFIVALALLTSFSFAAQAQTELGTDFELNKCRTSNTEFKKYIDSRRKNTIQFEGDTVAILQCTTYTAQKHFRIIYDTAQATPSPEFPFERKPVSPWDDNHNGIPDFVDSVGIFLERAYDFYLNRIGYRHPDCGFAGIQSDYTDVFLLNIGEGTVGVYGYTAQYTTHLPNGKSPTYIFMDNDYSATDSSLNGQGQKQRTYKDTGNFAAKITAAHEYHHCIQMGCAFEYSWFSKIGEMTSTGMEVRLYPETTDYLQFVRALFRDFSQKKFTDPNDNVGYYWSIFTQYIVHEFGDSLLLRFWQMTNLPKHHLELLDSAFRERGSSLGAEWCKFMDWIYFTGSRSIDGEYFPQARLFPTSFSNKIDGKYNYGLYNYSDPSTGESGSLYPYDLRGVKVVFPSTQTNRNTDTCLFIMTNTDYSSILNETYQSLDYSLICSSQQSHGMEKLGNLNYFYTQFQPSPFLCSHYYVNAGVPTEEPASAYPNPFRPAVHSDIFFPAPESSQTGDKVKVVVFSADMVALAEFTALVENGENTHMHETPVFAKVARWSEIREKLASGVYLYQVHFGSDFTFGKFAVLK